MDEYIISMVIPGVMFWTTLFLTVRSLFPKRSFEFWNRTTSTMHAIAAVSSACLSVQDWTCPVCPRASRCSPSQMKALAVTQSYLIYDLICTILGNHFSIDNAAHHLISIIGISAGLAYEKFGSEMVLALFLTEISSPFLHMREILKEFNIKDTDLNLTLDILFAITFSIARMVGGPYLLYIVLDANNPFLINAMSLGLQLVSTFWFYKILGMIKYKLVKRRNHAKLN